MPCDAFEVYGTVYGFYAKLQVGVNARAMRPIQYAVYIDYCSIRESRDRERGCEAADVSAEQLVPSADVR